MLGFVRRVRRSAVAVLAVLIVAIGAAATSGATGVVHAAVMRPMAVTTLPSTTASSSTTLEPTTTTTETTSTTEPSTSTSSSTTTTTIAPAATSSSSSSSTPWGWIIAILAVIAIALIIVLVFLRRSANQRKKEWNASAISALRDADLTRDMLAGEAAPGQPEDAARLTAVRASVDRVATSFEQLAVDAPNDRLRQNATGLASSLRGYLFALEAEQLLRRAPSPPSGEQLASADATKRARAADLDAAINAIRADVVPPEPRK